VVTHRLQVERRTVKSAGEKTDVLPLFHATNGDPSRWIPLLAPNEAFYRSASLRPSRIAAMFTPMCGSDTHVL